MLLEETTTEPARPAPSRLNPSFQELLTQTPAVPDVVPPAVKLTLPQPVYPQYPGKSGDVRGCQIPAEER